MEKKKEKKRKSYYQRTIEKRGPGPIMRQGKRSWRQGGIIVWFTLNDWVGAALRSWAQTPTRAVKAVLTLILTVLGADI